MKAAALKYTVLSLAATLAIYIIVLVPFHAFLTVWLSSFNGNYTALRLWKEGLLVVAALAALYLLITDHKIRTHTLSRRLVWLVIAYAGLHGVVGLIAYQNGDVTLKSLLYGFVVNLRFLVFFMVVWAIALRTSRLKANWQKLVIWPAAVVIVFGLLQITVLSPNFLANFGYGPNTIAVTETVNSNPDYVRISSTLRGPNPLGAYLIVPSTILLLLVLRAERKWRLALLLAGAMVVLAASFSRSGALGTFISLSLIALYVYRNQITRKVALGVGAGLVGLALIAALIVPNSARLQNIFFHTDSQSEITVSSNDERLDAIQFGLRDIRDEPLGEGPGSAGPASVYNDNKVEIAENYYLQIGQEVGVIGLILFLLINVGVGYLLWLRRADPLALALFASLIGISLVNMLSHAWTDDTLAYIWWGLAGIAMASLPTVEPELNTEQSQDPEPKPNAKK